MLTVVAALIGILIGAIGAAVGLFALSGSRVRAAETARERLLAEAERDAETVRRESQVEAREQAVQLRSEIEAELGETRLQIAKVEERDPAEGGGDRREARRDRAARAGPG